MSKTLVFILFQALYVCQVMAATFIPLPHETQLEGADAVIQGKYKGESYKKLPNGKIVTEAAFDVSKQSGLNPNEILNPKEFKVTYPGGIWEGITTHVTASPTFNYGEEVVLILKKGSYGLGLQNLALGKYNLIKEDSTTYLASSVFPNHPQLGKYPFKEFRDLVESTIGKPLDKLVSDKTIILKTSSPKKVASRVDPQLDNENERTPASAELEDEAQSMNLLYVFILIIGILGIFFIWRMSQVGNNKKR